MTITTKDLEDVLPVVTPANWIAGPSQGHWTYDDYAKIPEDGNRYEIIDGVLYMTPSPNFYHQKANVLITSYLVTHIKHKKLGEVLAAPFDVKLPFGDTVQPDVLVILNEHKERITPAKLEGAPDLVVEVASPSTAGYDRRQKQDAYARAAVPEYWIVNPEAQAVEVLVLEQDAYRSLGVFRGKALLPSQVIAKFPVKVEQFFV